MRKLHALLPVIASVSLLMPTAMLGANKQVKIVERTDAAMGTRYFAPKECFQKRHPVLITWTICPVIEQAAGKQPTMALAVEMGGAIGNFSVASLSVNTDGNVTTFPNLDWTQKTYATASIFDGSIPKQVAIPLLRDGLNRLATAHDIYFVFAEPGTDYRVDLHIGNKDLVKFESMCEAIEAKYDSLATAQ